MEELLDCIILLPIRLSRHEPIIKRALELALEYTITVYDALFLSLADENNAWLITADRLLAQAAKELGVN